VVAIAAPFRVIAAPETNPLPVAVNVNEGLPAATAEGEMDVRLNEPPPVPPVMVRVNVPEVVESGFITRMLTIPALAICGVVTLAVSWVEEETVVGKEVPFQRMVVPLTKFVPVAVRVNAAPPAATVVGVIVDSVGERTPLNPPHPHRKTKRTRGTKKI
jgi:hypothetical protein